MSDWVDWFAKFERVRDFISTLFSTEELRTWRGKSDFYTLFLALAPLAERTPKLTINERDAVRSALRLFRTQVDQAKRKDNQRKFAGDIHEYAEAVTRAASDLGRRNARLEILENRLNNALVRAVRRQRGQSRARAA
jgi:hypothetical protein